MPSDEKGPWAMLLLSLLFLSGCRSTSSTIEVQAVVGDEKPSVVVVAKVVMP